MLVIMYSIPYSSLFSNWLAIGIFEKKSTKGFFKEMYEFELLQQVKKDFSRDDTALVYQDHFGVMATMSKTGQCNIEVNSRLHLRTMSTNSFFALLVFLSSQN